MALVVVSASDVPVSFTTTPSSPAPSTVTAPMTTEVRIQEPLKLTVAFWPSVAIVAVWLVLSKLPSPAKPLIVTV